MRPMASSPARTPARTALLSGLREPMTIGVLVSLGLHAALIGLHFVDPVGASRAAQETRLEVVLVNARGERRPERPEVQAQANLEGAGDRPGERPVSMLPASARLQDAPDLTVQRRRAEQLVEAQRRLLLGAQGTPMRADPQRNERAATATGDDRREIEQALMRLQAQLEREIVDGGSGARRLTYGISAVGVSHARYVDDWVRRVERLGTEQYPPEARGKAYDALLVTVEIHRSGKVLDVILHNPSRHDVLNRAVRRVVLAAAPYPEFSPEMAREADSLRIVRTWNFTNDALATRASEAR